MVVALPPEWLSQQQPLTTWFSWRGVGPEPIRARGGGRGGGGGGGGGGENAEVKEDTEAVVKAEVKAEVKAVVKAEVKAAVKAAVKAEVQAAVGVAEERVAAPGGRAARSRWAARG